MRKVVTPSFGPLEQLQVVEGPNLEPGPGEVVIEVEAAGANFVDALMCQGLYQVKPALPYTPGTEVAGRVGALGDGVEGVEPGARVLALPHGGGYASQVVVPAAALVAVPEQLTAGQAAGLVQSYGTMLYALTRRTTVTPNEWVVVLGAGGGIGLAAVDLASTMGARVVACASSAEKLALAEAAGAVATINYEHEGVDLKAAIREVTGGGAHLVADPVGGQRAESALRALRWGGRYLVVGFAAGEIPRFPLNQVLLNSRTLIGVEWGAWIGRFPEQNVVLMAELLDLVATGAIHPIEPEARPLGDAVSLLHDLQARRVAGKVVLVP
ncbi:MAG: NADPH:quinone oxidoreductase family protein [Ilumatobacteraceae bacterium]